jgi:hypothetical protein
VSEARDLGEASNHEQLVALLAARKEALGISNQVLDEVALLSPGHVSKTLGPGRERGLSQITIDALLGALAVRLVVVEDEAQAAIMKTRWESRDQRQVRPPARIGAAFLKRARPEILRAFSRKGGQARWKGTTPELRRKLMRAVWKVRTVPAQLRASAATENTCGQVDR